MSIIAKKLFEVYEIEKEEKFFEDFRLLALALNEITLPDRIKAVNSKEKFATKWKIPKEKAIREYKWIEYNTFGLHALIFDVDYKIGLDRLKSLINQKIGVAPTWVCLTDKGAQFGFILNSYIAFKHEKAIKLALLIKKEITKLIKADVNGSHRLKGFWRNPLRHDFLFEDVRCSLPDFYHILPKPKSKRKKSNTQKFRSEIVARKIAENRFGFEKGNRNDWLFRIGMLQSKNKSWGDNEEEVRRLLISIMYEVSTPDSGLLPHTEIRAMAKSIAGYNREGKNRVGGNFSLPPENFKRGAMRFKPIFDEYGSLSPDDYEKVIKERQRKSATRTNKIIAKNGDKKMTREENMRKVTKARAEAKKRKVFNALSGLFADDFKKKNGKWNVTKIAKELNLTRNTTAKYVAEFEAQKQK